MNVFRMLVGLLLSTLPLQLVADDATPSALEGEGIAISQQIRAKMDAGLATIELLAPDFAALDALMAKHPEKNEDTAQLALTRAWLYLLVNGDEEACKRLLTAVVAEYKGTKAVAAAQALLNTMTPEANAEQAKRQVHLDSLVGLPAPELHFIWSSENNLQTLSSLRGKVVVLDFWATWCSPCIWSFPKIREIAAHFEGGPVMCLGVTSIQGSVSNLEPQQVFTKDDPEKEIALTAAFMKAKNMTWNVVISKEPVYNTDYAVDGIPCIVIIAPDGTVRYNGLHPSGARAAIIAKVESLLKEFNLPCRTAKI